MKNKIIAFGPMIGLPSTDWVGRDIADEINRQLNNVKFFKSFEEKIDADIIFIVKIMPRLQWIIEKKANGIKLIYIPVDLFSAPFKIIQHKEKLKKFDAIAIHNSRLGQSLSKYNKNIFFIEHYLKYQLAPKPAYKKDGYVLWVGHLEYLPALIIKLNTTSLKEKLLVLVDLENFDNKRAAMKNELSKAKIPWSETKNSDGSYLICNILAEQWTEKRQEQALMECKASFDTKRDSFAHNYKPPTKAQQYIFNNIPFATDRYSYSSQYFDERGLIIPSLNDVDRWLSEEYFNEIYQFNIRMKHRVELSNVATSYINILNYILMSRDFKGMESKSLSMLRDKLNFLTAAFIKIFKL